MQPGRSAPAQNYCYCTSEGNFPANFRKVQSMLCFPCIEDPFIPKHIFKINEFLMTVAQTCPLHINLLQSKTIIIIILEWVVWPAKCIWIIYYELRTNGAALKYTYTINTEYLSHLKHRASSFWMVFFSSTVILNSYLQIYFNHFFLILFYAVI